MVAAIRPSYAGYTAATSSFRGGAYLMPMTLNHTIVPSHNKEESAKFFARIMGLEYKGAWGHFAPVHVNGDTSLDWDNRDHFEPHHYAFLISEEEFDQIFER